MQEEIRALIELYKPIGEMYDRLRNADLLRYERWLLGEARGVVAREVAQQRFTSAEEIKYFAHGFAGVQAAVSNPRGAGLEHVFREGRRAKEEKGMAQRIRVKAEELRPTQEHCLESWLVDVAYRFGPVPWKMPFKG